jgi:long-chain acyl-CoA synthetase
MTRGLQRFVDGKGDDIAIIDEFAELTWSELSKRENQLIHGLRGLGLRSGDAVGLLGNNRHEWVEVLGADAHGSWVTVPINWHFSVDEIAYVLENSGAKSLVADLEFADKAAAAAEQARIDVRIMFGGAADDFHDYEELLASASPDEPAEQGAGGTMFYTSGTTGRPKGVKSTIITVGGDPVAAQATLEAFIDLLGLPKGDGRVLCNAPVYHAGPLVFCLLPMTCGSTIVMRRKWDARETLQLIDEHDITSLYAVPTHFVRLLKLPDDVRSSFDGSSLNCVYHTAAPCPPEVKRQMIEWWGPVINEMYGASESGGAGCTVTSEQWLAKPGTVGPPLPTTEVLIIGADGERLGPNETGQIYLRNLLGTDFEYLGDPSKTAEAHLEPGVFTFGDIGHVDDDGYLFLSDRKIDMIISGGVNIYPAEIEAVLITHPAVADVGVFGVPNDEFGEEVKAVVELADGHEPSDDLEHELKRLCRDRLAGYMVPRSIDFETLPRTATGKLLKKELRAPYWEGIDRAI